MTLSDPQVRRYARQILLREVGGRGQERLTGTAVEVIGDGPGLSVAATYVAAGGSPVDAPGPIGAFLAGTRLSDYSLEPPRQPAQLRLAAAPAQVAPGGVVVGGNGVAFCSEGACPACFAAACSRLTADAEPAHAAVTVGALAALLVQRLALGMRGPTAGVVLVDGPAMQLSEPRCDEHGAAAAR